MLVGSVAGADTQTINRGGIGQQHLKVRAGAATAHGADGKGAIVIDLANDPITLKIQGLFASTSLRILKH